MANPEGPWWAVPRQEDDDLDEDVVFRAWAVQQVRYGVKYTGRLMVEAQTELRDGVAHVTGLAIRPAAQYNPEHSVTPADLKALAAALPAVADWVAASQVAQEAGIEDFGQHMRTWGRAERDLARRRRRRHVDDEHLRQVAAVYEAAVKNGIPVRHAVAEAFGYSGSQGLSTVSKWIRAARDRGFLADTEGRER
jgi:hypothetical protein